MNESVVELCEIEPGIVKITMQDKKYKNTFSDELVNGLVNAFEKINPNESYKVVIITGYDSYFSSGGTKEGLLDIYEGKQNFTDVNIYSLALECPIPVIAAMQGHGIGGGFVMGLYCDFVVLAKEGVYTTNFMKYGFTPGMGATYIIPKKLGFTMGEEFLLGAKSYRGAELEKRGIPFKVLPRKDVLEYSLELARDLAQRPRVSLVTLKNHLVKEIKKIFQ